MITIKTPEEIEIMKEAGKILARVMKKVAKMVRPGITTKSLDKAAEGLIFRYGATPSFKGYQGFPATFCICLNEEVVHCVPSERKLKEGDIVSLDGGLVFNSFHSDMAITIPVLSPSSQDKAGKVSLEAQRLLRVTKKALKRGIKKVRPGRTFGDVGNSIQRYVEGQGFNVIRDLGGHGIGRNLHEDPQVLNYGKRGKGLKIKEGMVFCIEPMVSTGTWKLKTARDGYGYQTKDGSLSAHFEHTVAVTRNGYEILTE